MVRYMPDTHHIKPDLCAVGNIAVHAGSTDALLLEGVNGSSCGRVVHVRHYDCRPFTPQPLGNGVAYAPGSSRHYRDLQRR